MMKMKFNWLNEIKTVLSTSQHIPVEADTSRSRYRLKQILVEADTGRSRYQ